MSGVDVTIKKARRPRGTHPGHAAKIRHSYPYQISTHRFGQPEKPLRVDQTLKYFDLEDVLVLALGSVSMGQKALSKWRKGMIGDELHAYIEASPEFGVDSNTGLIKLQWTEGSTAARGRGRVAGTAGACCMAISLMAQQRKSSAKKGEPSIQRWLRKVIEKHAGIVELEHLWQEHREIFKSPRLLPDSLAEMPDMPFDHFVAE